MAVSEATDSDQPTPAVPPNLRVASEEGKECGNCVYFKNGEDCSKFPPLCVSDEWVCDAWKAGGKDTDEGSEPARTVRQAGKRAMVMANAVRAANR